MIEPEVIRLFPTSEEAMKYRQVKGTGGWIFAPEGSGFSAILFPPDWYPTQIFNHPITARQFGRLIF